jgi:radical S-adenosyl methionine domain-containing protein 2
MSISSRTATSLPPTVNLHLVAYCNMKCAYCYARFEDERAARRLPVEDLIAVIDQLADHHVRRLTFAGGEPTLHPHLATLLAHASHRGIVTSVVSNGEFLTDDWLALHGPHLRWITLSIDSVDGPTANALGRRTLRQVGTHVDRIVAVCARVHAWNARRPRARRIRLKLNITVTNKNAHEDPTAVIRACRPEKVKLFQMLLVAGENDDAADLACAPADYAAYVARVEPLAREGIEVVPEDNEAMDGSYAMIDPLARFYQRVDGTYRRSQPITEVGVMTAWSEVGGFDATRFVDRGGDYEPGGLATGNAPYLIALEGADGVGKSTVARMLATALGGQVVTSPPPSLAHERAQADAAPATERRAWYLRANRVSAETTETIRAQGIPVVMDRGAASTLAYAAAESETEVAPWPSDLPRPDLLIVLELDEAERTRRITTRGLACTDEELRLAGDGGYRARLRTAYAAMGARFVDASGPVADVVARLRAIAAE